MLFPEIRSIHSPDIEPPAVPEDPYDCDVWFQAAIGPIGEEESELFTFRVITAARLARSTEPIWGRGKLLLPMFEWRAVIEAVATLLARSARDSWAEVVAELDKELCWESSSADA